MNIPEPSLNERWAKWVLKRFGELCNHQECIIEYLETAEWEQLKKMAGEKAND